MGGASHGGIVSGTAAPPAGAPYTVGDGMVDGRRRVCGDIDGRAN